MKIAYLSTFYPFRGGIAQFNASIYNELKKTHEVKAFTFKRQYPNFLFPGETQYVTEKDNAEVIESFELLDTVNPFNYFNTARKIKKFEPDLLIMKYWMSFFGPSLGTVAKQLKKKTKVITILDNVIPHEKRFFDQAFTKYFLKQNHAFIAMSNKVKNDLLTLRPNGKVLLKPHPLYDHFGEKADKMQAREQLKISKEKKTILFFGFIRDYKGLDLLLDAFSKLNNEQYQLIIAGESYGSFDKYDQLIEASANKKGIHKFVRYINDSEVPTFFSASDVCVLPYKSATQSGITSISYHFEVPLIATNVGGLKESITHGKTGLIIDTPESNEIAKTIETFFESESFGSYENNIKDLKHELSWESFAKSIIDLYNEID